VQQLAEYQNRQKEDK